MKQQRHIQTTRTLLSRFRYWGRKNYNYHRNNFSLDNGFGTLQIYVGFNFNLRKEYRRKNTR